MAAFAAPIAGIVGGIASGIIGSGAAKKAGQFQYDSSLRAGDLMHNMVASVNPDIQNAAAGAGHDVSVAAGNAGAGVTNAADRANGLLAPYVGVGQDAAGYMSDFMGPNGPGNHAFTADDMAAYDPGYQFRLAQGMKALNNSMAAHGMSDSGAALKAAARYGQDYSSNEFQNAFQRNEQQTNDRFARLSGVMGMGMSASGMSGQNVMNAAQYSGNAGMSAAEYGGNAGMHAADLTAANSIHGAEYQGDALMGGANAKAAGIMGAANAWTNGISTAVNGITGGMAMNRLFPSGGSQAGPSFQALANLPQSGMPSYMTPGVSFAPGQSAGYR